MVRHSGENSQTLTPLKFIFEELLIANYLESFWPEHVERQNEAR